MTGTGSAGVSLRAQGLVAIEVAPAAIAAAEAGAAVVHFHARGDDGGQHWAGHDTYRAAMTAIAQGGSDVLTYPSYLSSDLSHVWALADDPPAGPGLRFGPFDVPQHIRRVQWNHAEGRIEGMTVLGGDHSQAARPPELEEFRARRLIPSIAAFELGEVRWVALAARSGLLDTPVCLKVFLNDTWIRGPGADEVGLDALLSQLPPDLDAEVTIVPYEMADAERTWALLDAALARGHHIRVGIGDNPGAFPTATNAELVERAVALAARHGLRPATPAQVLARFSDRSGCRC